MPRTFVPKGGRQTDRSNLKKAFNYRVETKCSIRTACNEFGVKFMTLQDAFKRSRAQADGQTYIPMKPHNKQVFKKDEEEKLANYLIKVAKLFHGLSRKELRKLAYQYALACESQNIPTVWHKDEAATFDWYYGYMKRHPNLSLKSPESMSIARAISFNKANVESFFKAYIEAMEKHSFSPDRIYNIDETSLSTVIKSVKVVCEGGKAVTSQISRERGATITFVGIINAVGHYIPPVYIIPRKRWNDPFMRGTVDGAKGILHANGWMNGDCFVQTLEHIKEKTYCTPDNKILLIMDNAECHMNIAAVEYAIKNGIVIVTLPPHTTEKLQPLDVSVYGPFKTCLCAIMADFILTNPHAHVTEHILPELSSRAWVKSCTPNNVLSGFKATGIWPVNKDIFSEDDFLGSTVSERPSAVDTEISIVESEDQNNKSPDTAQEQSSTTSALLDLEQPSSTSTPSWPLQDRSETWTSQLSQPQSASFTSTDSSLSYFSPPVSPEAVRPLPKAHARTQGKGCKKVKSYILTENEDALADLREKARKRAEKEQKTQVRKNIKISRAVRKKQEDVDSEDEDGNLAMHLSDSSEYSNKEFNNDVNTFAKLDVFQDKNPEKEDFLLVEREVEEGKTKGTKAGLLPHHLFKHFDYM